MAVQSQRKQNCFALGNCWYFKYIRNMEVLQNIQKIIEMCI